MKKNFYLAGIVIGYGLYKKIIKLSRSVQKNMAEYGGMVVKQFRGAVQFPNKS